MTYAGIVEIVNEPGFLALLAVVTFVTVYCGCLLLRAIASAISRRI